MADKPIAMKRLGGVQVAIWAGQYGVSLTVSKSYKDKNTQQWVNTNFLNTGEAIIAHRLLGEAITAAIKADTENRPQQGQGGRQQSQGRQGGDPDADFHNHFDQPQQGNGETPL